MTDNHLWVPSEDLVTAQLPGVDILGQECVPWSWYNEDEAGPGHALGTLSTCGWAPL